MTNATNGKARKKRSRASVLLASTILATITAAMVIGLMSTSQYNVRRQKMRVDSNQAYYLAENAMLEGVQIIAEQSSTSDIDALLGTYLVKPHVDPAPTGFYNANLPFILPSEIETLTYSIQPDPVGEAAHYLVSAKAEIRGREREVFCRVQFRPPSQVFNYEYFLNNWGWWWGSSIIGNGDNRANWDFDYKYNPTVNGHIYAAGDIEQNGSPVDPFNGTIPFKGWAGADPVTYVHPGTKRVKMPNLKDLSYYEVKANGSIVQNGATIISGIHGSDSNKLGVYLKGTSAHPIEINGTVVIHGDCVISGVVTGTGSLYIGNNLYVAGNIEYADPPDYQLPPNHGSLTPKERQDWYDQWVDDTIEADKDMVSFAARGHILEGKVNDSSWKSTCFNNSAYGMKYLGREDTLGQDGIRGTPDDNVDYLDTNGDGTPDSAAYDADDDGIIRTTNYNYNTELKMTSSRASMITNYPVDNNDNPKDYNSVASDQITKLHGIFYTNHSIAQRSKKGPENMFGAMICRDEAIIFSNKLTFWYDWRIHSRYHNKYYDNDGNKIIDLDLPVSLSVGIKERSEKYDAMFAGIY